jgi:prepilin-type N-terminal cleavage/methylation domain-containing protein
MNRHAFTLLELIVVVGILALLFSALFLLLKPAEKFAEGRNVKRRLEVE